MANETLPSSAIPVKGIKTLHLFRSLTLEMLHCGEIFNNHVKNEGQVLFFDMIKIKDLTL